MLFSWFALTLIVINLSNNLECDAVKTDKTPEIIEHEFLLRHQGNNNPTGKVESSLSLPRDNYKGKGDVQKQLQEICAAVMDRPVLKGKGSYSAFNKAMFKAEQLLIVRYDSDIVTWVYIPVIVLVCPNGKSPVSYVRESAVAENTNCYYVLEDVTGHLDENRDSCIRFAYESCLPAPNASHTDHADDSSTGVEPVVPS